MARNRQAIVPRWRPGDPQPHLPWFAAALRQLERVLGQWADVLDDGPIPGQTIAFQLGPIALDNSGGGASVVTRLHLSPECAFEPVAAVATARTVTGSAVTVDIRTGTWGGAPTTILAATLSLAVAAAGVRDIRDNQSDFVTGEIDRQSEIRIDYTVPAGATVTGLVIRLIGRRSGRIADVGVTRTLGR